MPNTFQKTTELRTLFKWIISHPLNKGRRLKALSRFFRWQLASRLLKDGIIVPFAGGTKLLMRNGMTGATGNYYCGLHEPSEMAFLLHCIQSGEIFFDVGSNVGTYTILAAGVRRARVVAFEPAVLAIDGLRLNIAVNNLADLVSVMQVGLSDVAGRGQLTNGLDTMNHVVRDETDDNTQGIELRKMDEFLMLGQPTIIKIDVEGYEEQVLKGANATLQIHSLLAVIMETNGSGKRFGSRDTAVSDMMLTYGFERMTYDPFRRELKIASGTELNTIFVRDRAEVERRLKTSSAVILGSGAQI